MRIRRLCVVAVALAAIAGCAATDDSQSPDMPHGTHMPILTSASGQLAVNAADVMFVQMMIPHHEQAVEMSTLAATNTSNPEVLGLASAITAAQQPEIEMMRGWLATWNVTSVEHSMGEDGMLNDAQMAELAAARDADFDQLFLTGMIGHHNGAIAMAEQVLASGTSPDVRALARQVIASQQAEVTTMSRLLAS